MSNENIEIPRGTLSQADMDMLSGMMIIFLKCAEKCIQMLELHYEMEYKAGQQYKVLCKRYGKKTTDAIVEQQVRKIMRGDERNRLGLILKAAKDMHKNMDYLVDSGMKAHGSNTTDMQTFDAMQHDANFLVNLYAMMGNCTSADDEIKIASTVKALAKGHRVSDNLLDKLKMQ